MKAAPRSVLLLPLLTLGWAGQARAQTPAPDDAEDGWFRRVDRTQAEQPHWITPLVTVTPRLEEEYRFDFFHEELARGARTTNYDGGKGLELIPARRVEIILGVPPYLTHTPASARQPTGWGDTNFLLKYRLLASNEKTHNHIITLFFGATSTSRAPSA
ncbi:MAG: hypothetical protein DMG21_21025 [Acidobacteria bacterium]|nr:MAG: hypothetical protein DMG21_21025 [Acidobacteriota bacterium]